MVKKTRQPGETFGELMKRFRTAVKQEKILEEYKRRTAYETPREREARKREAGRRYRRVNKYYIDKVLLIYPPV